MKSNKIIYLFGLSLLASNTYSQSNFSNDFSPMSDYVIKELKEGRKESDVLIEIQNASRRKEILAFIASASLREHVDESSILLRTAYHLDRKMFQEYFSMSLLQLIKKDDIEGVARLIKCVPNSELLTLDEHDILKIFSSTKYALLMINDNGSNISPILNLLKRVKISDQNKEEFIKFLDAHIKLSDGRYLPGYEVDKLAQDIRDGLSPGG